jgi:hypothetical protein
MGNVYARGTATHLKYPPGDQRIIKGENLADLPVRQPTKSEEQMPHELNKFFLSVLLVFITSATTPASAQTVRQNCRGVLTRNEDGYHLKPHSGSALWCDSYIAGDLLQKVLKVCAVDSHCHIKGSVRGHGVFYWVRISSVRGLPTVSGRPTDR